MASKVWKFVLADLESKPVNTASRALLSAIVVAALHQFGVA